MSAVRTNLARIPLVLSPGRAGRGWILWCALVVAALLAGAAASHVYWHERLGTLPAPATVAVTDLQPLQHALEQARLQLRVSEAHGQELERQIDALNQRLRECQDELTFFRKARKTQH